MANQNVEILSYAIWTGLHLMYEHDFAKSWDEVLENATKIRNMFYDINDINPLTDKEWSEVLADIGTYAQSLIWQQKAFKRYVARGCKDTLFHKMEVPGVIITAIKTSIENAQYFSVYGIHDDGTEEWIADFREWSDAQMFTMEKEKEEIK